MRFLIKLCSFALLYLLSRQLQVDAISNGRVAGNGYPWIGILRTDSPLGDYGGLFCTGTIIAPTLVLTAGHCLTRWKTNYNKIAAVFDQSVLTNGLGGQRSTAKQIYFHPSFNQADRLTDLNTIGIDIALIELKTPIRLSAYPPLAFQGPVKPGSTVQAIGSNGNGPAEPTTDLMTVQQSVLEPSQCVSPHALSYTICTDTSQGGVCEADSGSPLLAQGSNNQPMIVGVASRKFTQGTPATCSLPGNKNIFTSVAEARSWIVPSLVEASVSQGMLKLRVGPNFQPLVRIEIKLTGGLSLSERVFDVREQNGWTAQTKILAYSGYLHDVVLLEISLSNGIHVETQTAKVQF